MAKKKKDSRLNKREIRNRLLCVFEEAPSDAAFHYKDLAAIIGAKHHGTKMVMLDVLSELVFDDYLMTDQRGKYCRSVRTTQEMEGTFRRKRSGHHLFVPDDGGEPLIVTESHAMHALDGDRVRATMLARRRGGEREAEVIEIVERTRDTFVGILQIDRGYGFLVTDGRQIGSDIFIPRDALRGGKDGDKAVVQITEWPARSKCPVGKVVDILGRQGENDAEMHAILAEFGLPYTYPERISAAAQRIDAGITDDEVSRREDLRQVTTMTIDPRDAKDFDDALSIRPKDNGLWEVGVHIADVSHYVREGSVIDREAFERATSTYLVDRTIPMLPEHLCNNICSLRQDEDKLTYSVIFTLTADAEVRNWRLRHTVTRSNRRFTYEEVQDIIERNGEASAEDLALPGNHPEVDGSFGEPRGEFAHEILMLNRLAKLLRAARFKRGSIGFDRPEIRFEIDEAGRPVSTYVKVARDANKLVEEFMLLANRTVAESVALVPKGKKAKVLPYRIHDVPDPEKMESLAKFAAGFGYKVRTEGSKTDIAKGLNRLLDDIHGTKEGPVIELVALRAMQKARYSVHNIGHYGLMFDHYTHFTSPIRRYPDLMVHRLLTRYAEGGRSVSVERYESLCEHCSAMEQLAAQAERASIKYKQVEFMAARKGQEFDGTVSGVTEFGIYVEEDESKCEGMVPIRNLAGDYYEFDERNYRLVGRRTHHVYALGDKVRIRVDNANLERRTLDYAIILSEEDKRLATPARKIQKPDHYATKGKGKGKRRRK